jgi:class 3 adenylate cyclase
VGPPSGTLTFLFTDIEGSTRLWQAGEEAMRAAVARHDQLLQQAIFDHHGTLFATTGDGMAAAFSSAGAALAAALAAQRSIAEEEWATAAPIRVRMGLHTGEAHLRDGNYFGTAVNRAARLMNVGHGGQVLCSQVTAALIEDEVALSDLGEHRLRDLDRPVHVFQVGEGAFGPLRSVDALPGNLPVLTSSFVGRQSELLTVTDDLRSHRLVTLTGVGGVGKTRLALQVAGDAMTQFADGVWLCELATAATDEAMVHVVAAALGVLPRQQMTMAQSIVDFLRTRQLLVVLDNCEHLLDAVADLAEAILGGGARGAAPGHQPGGTRYHRRACAPPAVPAAVGR